MSKTFYFEMGEELLSDTLDDIEEFLNCARYNDDDDVELVEKYLARNPTNVDVCDDHGRTAVHMAAANGHLRILEVLLRFNPQPNLVNKEGHTALHFAALNNRVATAKLLLCKGWKANAVNIFNRTPLHLIQGKGFEEMETLLLSYDASLEILEDELGSAKTESASNSEGEKQEHKDNEEEDSALKMSPRAEHLFQKSPIASILSSKREASPAKFAPYIRNTESLLGFSRVDEVE